MLSDLPRRLRRVSSAGLYKPEIDGLRFFAIAMVIFGHLLTRLDHFHPVGPSSPLADRFLSGMMNPGLGVLLFFSISGFIIASQFLNKGVDPLTGGFLKPYFLRRITRIEPPYFILLIATFVFIAITGWTPPDSPRFMARPASLLESLLASLFYAHGLLFGTLPRLFPPGWSLEVEVQFYLVAPLLFYAMFKWFGLTARPWLGLAGLAASLVIQHLAAQQGGPHLHWTLLVFLPYFLAGIVLADVNQRYLERLKAVPAAPMGWFGWSALVLFLCAENLPLHLDIVPMQIASIAGMFVSAMTHGSFRAFCSRPWISLIGGACYSLYLTHLQVEQVGTAVATWVLPNFIRQSYGGLLFAEGLVLIPLVIAAGLVFYALIERPFMVVGWPSKVWNRIRKGTAENRLAAGRETRG